MTDEVMSKKDEKELRRMIRELKSKLPVLRGFIKRSKHGDVIKVWCPFCHEWHHHGWNDDLFRNMGGLRNAHCAPLVRKQNESRSESCSEECVSPFRKTGYFIEPYPISK